MFRSTVSGWASNPDVLGDTGLDGMDEDMSSDTDVDDEAIADFDNDFSSGPGDNKNNNMAR